MGKYFGTDGVRGVANRQLTPELVYKIGRCGGYVLTHNQTQTPRPLVLIGRDPRISGAMFEASLVAGLLSIGADVIRLGVLTTPAVAYLTRHLHADAGVMISASHNPFEDNGIKFFGSDGYKLDDQTESEIEKLLDATEDTLPRPVKQHLGTVQDDHEAKWRYADYVQKLSAVRFDGMRIVIDCAHGAAHELAPRIFSQLGAHVIAIGDKPNGRNINDGVGSTHVEVICQETLRHHAHLGLSFDGDADRLIAVDEKGQLVDGDHLLCIFGTHLGKSGRLPHNTVVTTVMSNLGFYKAAKTEGFHTVQTAVGDRYVVEAMKQGGYTLGGEQSGHIVFLEHNTTGDGIITALQLTRIVAESRKPLSQWRQMMVKYPQVLLNVKVQNKNEDWKANAQIMQCIHEVEDALGDQGRILVRNSGTEPIVRIMIEGAHRQEIERHAQRIAQAFHLHFGSRESGSYNRGLLTSEQRFDSGIV